MLYIFLFWVYIFFCASLAGVGINEFFNLKNKFVVTQLLGFFAISLFAGYFAIFYKIGIVFHGFLFTILLLVFFRTRKSFGDHLREFHAGFLKMQLFSKIGFLLVSFLILAQCASPPYIIDNESYYIQTIKWLNEYGYVTGLGNLHFFFGQTSGWHILQSAFNFSFIYDNFNDLSGYCLCLVNFFAFRKLSLAFTTQKNRKLNLGIGVLPLGNILFFQFISAPSPDLPVMVICFLIFYLLLKKYPDYSRTDFITICFLCFFVLFIKTINLFLVVVPIYVYWKSRENLKKEMWLALIIGFVTFAIMLIKNQILTGYPLYPLKLIHFDVDYTIPPELLDYLYRGTKRYAYLLSYDGYLSLSVWERLLHWLQLPGLKGIFNKTMMVMLLLLPFFLKKTSLKKPLFFIYLLLLVHMVILFITSPQYRFFLFFLLFFFGVIFAYFFQKEIFVKICLSLGILAVAFLIFVPLSFNLFTENPLMASGSTFQLNYAIEPHPNSQYNFKFRTITEGNLEYNSPPEDAFFWLMGDGELPCVNKKQIDLFQEHYKLVPQLRSGNLKDGFYSMKIKTP